MAINVTAVGAAGTHSFQKTSVNLVENYIWVKDNGVPAGLVTDTSWIYSNGVGSIGGITDDTLVFAKRASDSKISFSATAGGIDLDLTSVTAGSITFNKPVVYSNILSIDGSTTTNQAVKYYTNGTPLTGLVSGNTYFLKNVSASSFAGAQSLYTISGNAHTFTTCGQTGRQGPTQQQMRTSYTTPWDDVYISQGNFQGYQDWTVPVSGIYEFTVRGAAGYEGAGGGSAGQGAVVRGRVPLTKGEIITIIVGQRGAAPTSGGVWGGSGGGSFVVRKTGNEPLFVAGGGSADSNTTAGINGVLTQLGGRPTNNAVNTATPSFGGNSSNGFSGAGGGFVSRGGAGSAGDFGGGSYLDGLTMSTNSRIGGYGGFGGGGQSDGNNAGQSGGGGGYSGGAGSRSSNAAQSGGGGGSFISATATNVGTSTGLFDGQNTFNGASITNLSTYNNAEGTVDMTIVSTFTTGNEVYPTAANAEAGTSKIAIGPAGTSYHSFVPINFDSQNDLIHSPTVHGLVNGEAVTLNFNGTAPAGLTNGTTYYINTVNNFTYRLSTTASPTFQTINLTTPSTRETVTSSTISRVVANIVEDTLTISSHGFQVDQPLIYSTGGGTPIVPLVNGSTYYVQEVIDANRIRLKLSLTSLSYINLTAAGTGTGHSFIFATVNVAEDSLYIANHGLVDGQTVRYSNNGGTTIPGLTNNTTYYIKKVDNSIVKLA
jgi:hypothetical protein